MDNRFKNITYFQLVWIAMSIIMLLTISCTAPHKVSNVYGLGKNRLEVTQYTYPYKGKKNYLRFKVGPYKPFKLPEKYLQYGSVDNSSKLYKNAVLKYWGEDSCTCKSNQDTAREWDMVLQTTEELGLEASKIKWYYDTIKQRLNDARNKCIFYTVFIDPHRYSRKSFQKIVQVLSINKSTVDSVINNRGLLSHLHRGVLGLAVYGRLKQFTEVYKNGFGDKLVIYPNGLSAYKAKPKEPDPYEDMCQWLACQDPKAVKQLFLVHGEPDMQVDFKNRLVKKGFSDVLIPKAF